MGPGTPTWGCDLGRCAEQGIHFVNVHFFGGAIVGHKFDPGSWSWGVCGTGDSFRQHTSFQVSDSGSSPLQSRPVGPGKSVSKRSGGPGSPCLFSVRPPTSGRVIEQRGPFRLPLAPVLVGGRPIWVAISSSRGSLRRVRECVVMRVA